MGPVLQVCFDIFPAICSRLGTFVLVKQKLTMYRNIGRDSVINTWPGTCHVRFFLENTNRLRADVSVPRGRLRPEEKMMKGAGKASFRKMTGTTQSMVTRPFFYTRTSGSKRSGENEGKNPGKYRTDVHSHTQ